MDDYCVAEYRHRIIASREVLMPFLDENEIIGYQLNFDRICSIPEELQCYDTEQCRNELNLYIESSCLLQSVDEYAEWIEAQNITQEDKEKGIQEYKKLKEIEKKGDIKEYISNLSKPIEWRKEHWGGPHWCRCYDAEDHFEVVLVTWNVIPQDIIDQFINVISVEHPAEHICWMYTLADGPHVFHQIDIIDGKKTETDVDDEDKYDEWFRFMSDEKKEKIVLVPGANVTELLRSVALFGNGSFGVRFYNSAELLAEEMLQRVGVIVDQKISGTENSYLIDSIIRQSSVYENTTFTDSQNVWRSLNILRNVIPYTEEEEMRKLTEESEFAEKNSKLLSVYKMYRGQKGNKMDGIDIIREALAHDFELDIDFLSVDEFPLTPLEEALLDCLAKGNTRKIGLQELFGKEEKPYHNIQYIKAYGMSNEVENTLDYIFRKGLPLDDCVVAVADTKKYNSLFEEYGQKYNIPIAFARGTSIQNTNPFRLLKLYHDWDKEKYHGVDSLYAMIFSPYFNLDILKAEIGKEQKYEDLKKCVNRAGQLKLNSDREENLRKIAAYRPVHKIDENRAADIDVLEVLAKELGVNTVDFIEKYAVIREGQCDEEALRIIMNHLRLYDSLNQDRGLKGDYSDILDVLGSQPVGKSISGEGKLIVTDIRGALSSCRRNLFVLGLSAANFPGSIRENYLLLDEDLRLYGENVPTSDALEERRKNELYDVLRLYSAFDADIRLSYSCYDLVGLKADNASSVLLEIYKKQYPDATYENYEEAFIETGYFDDHLSISSEIGRATNKGKMIDPIPTGDIVAAPFDGKRSFSPSALETFFQCQKKFYLGRLLGIEEPDPEDPFTVIDARDYGTLAHSIMEHIANNKPSEEEFTEYVEKMFREFLRNRAPLNEEEAKKAEDDFVQMAVNGFKNDPHNEVMAAEEKISVLHPESGISIYGYPDRVEKDKNGKYLIADFKTKRKYDHKENDIGTCLQVVLYAYMMTHREDRPLPISFCEYRYLRYKDPVHCDYDREMESKLTDKLMQVKEALDTGVFQRTENEKENCKYCKFASICGKEKKEQVDDDE